MRRLVAIGLVAGATLIVAAPASAAPKRFAFTCADGTTLFVRYPKPDLAVVRKGGRTLRLPIARSGSGARYAAGDTEYWEHQGEVRFTQGGAATTCTPAKARPARR